MFFRSMGIAIAIAGMSLMVTDAFAAARQANRCTSLQARCALEVGGTCNPNTGAWRYSCAGPSAGCVARFNDCVTRGLGRR